MERAVAFQGDDNYAQCGLLEIDEFLNRSGRTCATITCLAARHRAPSSRPPPFLLLFLREVANHCHSAFPARFGFTDDDPSKNLEERLFLTLHEP